MKKWNEPDGEMWGIDQVASFVEDFFKKNKAKVLEYKIVKYIVTELFSTGRLLETYS